MECADRFMSQAPYVGICECATSEKERRLSGSSSYEIGPSVSQMMSSIASEVTGFSRVSSVGEDRSMVIKAYCGPFPIHPQRYKLPLSTCRSGDLSMAPSRIEEHDARDSIRIYRDTTREYAMGFVILMFVYQLNRS